MKKRTRNDRVRELIAILTPALRFKKEANWTDPRVDTAWGTKTKVGLAAVIHRVMFEKD